MLVYTHLDPFPVTWQVLGLYPWSARGSHLPNKGLCCLHWSVCVSVGLSALGCVYWCRAVCIGLCVLVLGCLHWAVCAGLCALCVAKHAWPGTWWGHRAQVFCLPELRKKRLLDVFFSGVAWSWSGLDHGYLSIKTTHSHSSDLPPQPKRPFAAQLDPAASLTCVRARN